MTVDTVVELARGALMTSLVLAGPLLAVALAVGLLVSIVQAVTSIQEQTLAFVPKLLAVGVVFLMLLSWMLQVLMRYTTELLRQLPGFVG